jgi:hypothetical protein
VPVQRRSRGVADTDTPLSGDDVLQDKTHIAAADHLLHGFYRVYKDGAGVTPAHNIQTFTYSHILDISATGSCGEEKQLNSIHCTQQQD